MAKKDAKPLITPVIGNAVSLNNDGDLCKITKELRDISPDFVGMGSNLTPMSASHCARLKTLYEFQALSKGLTESEQIFLWLKLLFKNICLLRNSVDGYKSGLIKDMVGNFNKNVDVEDKVSEHERLDVDS